MTIAIYIRSLFISSIFQIRFLPVSNSTERQFSLLSFSVWKGCVFLLVFLHWRPRFGRSWIYLRIVFLYSIFHPSDKVFSSPFPHSQSYKNQNEINLTPQQNPNTQKQELLPWNLVFFCGYYQYKFELYSLGP